MDNHGDVLRPQYLKIAKWNRDGSLIAYSLSTGDVATVFVKRLNDLSLVRVLRGHAGPIASLSWSPNSECLASYGFDGLVRLWSIGDGACRAVLSPKSRIGISPHPHHHDYFHWSATPRPTRHVEFSHDGAVLCAVAQDGTATFWTSSDLEVLWDSGIADIREDFSLPSSISWSPDDANIAISSWDETVVIKRASEPHSSSMLRQLNSWQGGGVSSASWNGDGCRIATAQFCELQIWDVATASMVARTPRLFYPNTEIPIVIDHIRWLDDGHLCFTAANHLWLSICVWEEEMLGYSCEPCAAGVGHAAYPTDSAPHCMTCNTRLYGSDLWCCGHLHVRLNQFELEKSMGLHVEKYSAWAAELETLRPTTVFGDDGWGDSDDEAYELAWQRGTIVDLRSPGSNLVQIVIADGSVELWDVDSRVRLTELSLLS